MLCTCRQGILFPFIPFMVEDLRGTAEDMGLYVGIAVSAYQTGTFLASFIWPPLSGRRGC
jgi:MFS family permease